jgi:signal transduction histidine kinase
VGVVSARGYISRLMMVQPGNDGRWGCYDRNMGSDDDLSEGPHRSLGFLALAHPGSTIRRALLVGFAAIFALWLVSMYELVARVTEAERRTTAIITRFTEGEERLFTVTAQVFLSSVYVRDAILDSGPDTIAFYREQLRTTRAEVERAFQQHLPDMDSAAEREHWTRLQAEVHDFWNGLSPVLTGHVTRNAAEAQAFLNRDVIPKRELIIRIAENIRMLNHEALQQQQAEVAELHRGLRRRLWWTSGIAIAFALGIAVLAARQTERLESRIRQQHLQERQHKRDLQRLSADLVRAQEGERRTIARDLHDEIGQALMTIKLDLGTVERSAQVSGAAAQSLAEARSTTDEAIQTVRNLSQLLHPPMLDDFGLAVTVNAYVRSFSQRTRIRADLVLDGMDARVTSEVEVCAYRVIQEALTNVAKHAHATSCRVYLQRLPYSLLVTVEDDGKGMDSGRTGGTHTQRGVGLVGIRERVSRLGGTMRLDTSAGNGTRLTIELPVASVEAKSHEASSETGLPAVSQERG